LESVDGGAVEFWVAVRLPPSFTRLHLTTSSGRGLPGQLASLTRLHTLSLSQTGFSADSYAPLTCLTSLRRLAFERCDYVPACLPQLTWLEALAVIKCLDVEAGESNGATVRAALERLGSLTHLSLDSVHGMRRPPVALTRLTALRSLVWMPPPEAGVALQLTALPPGSWLAGLRSLEAPLEVLSSSLPALQAGAQALERVAAIHLSAAIQAAAVLSAVLRWAAGHPSLHTVEWKSCWRRPTSPALLYCSRAASPWCATTPSMMLPA
jgi:hypothetical protein